MKPTALEKKGRIKHSQLFILMFVLLIGSYIKKEREVFRNKSVQPKVAESAENFPKEDKLELQEVDKAKNAIQSETSRFVSN